MENASKALIIAGAILLAILLISLGIMIFSQAQDTVTNSGMSQAEITSYNSKFLKYEGDAVTGSEVKALFNEVQASNAEQGQTSSGRSVTFQLIKGGTTANITASSGISTSKTYKVEMGYDVNGGVINTIKVTENN